MNMNESDGKELLQGMVEGIDFMKQLEGKTIAKVRIHGVNCASVETTDGKFYMVSTVCVLPTLSLYGIDVEEVSRDDIIEADKSPECEQTVTC